MIFNATAPTLGPVSLRHITDEWDLPIAPANWAFSIWGLIYTLLAIWTVHQALPNSKAPERNNDVIVNQIGYVFAFNMACNALWLIIFEQDKPWGFALALVLTTGMLTS